MSDKVKEREAPVKTLEDLFREGQVGEFDHLKEWSDDKHIVPKKEGIDNAPRR